MQMQVTGGNQDKIFRSNKCLLITFKANDSFINLRIFQRTNARIFCSTETYLFTCFTRNTLLQLRFVTSNQVRFSV